MSISYRFEFSAGAQDRPIAPDAWKRAVYRPAPSKFTVEMLSPTKFGSSHSYGMLVSALKEDNSSTSSRGSASEYEVWRRWEDCLWFQETLELEYGRLAREKRTRLAAGKGVKRNGVYARSDLAASFESLPPGPDPRSVETDIHSYVPRLTKKGTLFRASPATIEQRARELKAMLNGLFKEDVPVLLKELRGSRTVTDFFGYWRRDHDLAVKLFGAPEGPPDGQHRHSIASSTNASLFSSSTPALNTPRSLTFADLPPPPPPFDGGGHGAPTSPGGRRRAGSIGSSPLVSSPRTPVPCPSARAAGKARQSFSDDESASPPTPSSARSRHRPSSSLSSFVFDPASPRPRTHSGSSGSTSASTSAHHHHRHPRHPAVVEEVPIVFGHNPHLGADAPSQERPASVVALEALPEEGEGELSLALPPSGVHAQEKAPVWLMEPPSRRGGKARHASRRGQGVYGAPYGEAAPRELPSGLALDPRQASQDSFFAELAQRLPMSPLPMGALGARASMASLASLATVDSADAIVPHLQRLEMQSRVREQEMYRHDGGEDDDSGEDTDVYEDAREGLGHDEPVLGQLPSSPSTASDSSSGTLSRHASLAPSSYADSFHTASTSAPTAYSALSSSALSNTTAATSATGGDPGLAIKATYAGTAVLLRVPRTLTLRQVRRRLRDRFAGQEGVRLPDSFIVFCAPPLAPPPSSSGGMGWGRARSSSVSSMGWASEEGGIGEAGMLPVCFEEEWAALMKGVTEAGVGKITLRVSESRF